MYRLPKGFGVWGLGFGVWGLGFGVWGLGFGVFRVEGLGFSYHFDVSDPIINSRKCLGFRV